MDANIIFNRHSVRAFSKKPLDIAVVNSLKAEITQAITREACVHFQLITNNGDPFTNFRKSYGMFHNANNYVACVVDSNYANSLQKGGYYAQQIVLKAAEMGVASCIVSGTFDVAKTNAQLRIGWKIPFLIVLGYSDEKHSTTLMSNMAHLIMKKGRPAPESLLSKDSLRWDYILSHYPKVAEGIRGAAAAPSALNHHPVRFNVMEEEGACKVIASAIENGDNAQIDLGAAMYNFQALAGGEWYFAKDAIWNSEIEF